MGVILQTLVGLGLYNQKRHKRVIMISDAFLSIYLFICTLIFSFDFRFLIFGFWEKRASERANAAFRGGGWASEPLFFWLFFMGGFRFSSGFGGGVYFMI